MKIICIGSSAKDIFFPTNEGVVYDTPEDLTSQKKFAFELGAKYQIDQIYAAPGGCATNVAQGLARLGVETGIYTKIGKDAIGEWIKDELENENVNTELIQVDEKCKSDLSAIIVDENTKDHTIFFNRDSNDKLEVLTEELINTEWLFLSALNGDWENNFDKILNHAEENDIKIAFNPGQKNIQDNAKKIVEIIKKSEILILNKDEAIEIILKSELSDDQEFLKDEKNLINKLAELGVKTIALTDGNRGSWVYKDGGFFHAKALNMNPVDTLGAGDSFTSAFLASCLKGEEIEECVKWAAANSANVVMYYGAKEGLLKEEEIKDKIKEIFVQKLN